MLIVTTEGVAQQPIVETKGQVFGVVVRSRVYWLLDISVPKNQEGNKHARAIPSPVW